MKSVKSTNFVKSRILLLDELPSVYKTLRKKFGHQDWWPGETPFEVMVGAILTQNTAWTNVEKAIHNLKKAKVLSVKKMNLLSQSKLAQLIRPAGYFNVKAIRLKNFVTYLMKNYQGNIRKMKSKSLHVLREELLEVNGIGPETADSILLYALDKTSFVIDAYTKRIFSRHRLEIDVTHLTERTRGKRSFGLHDQLGYHDWQNLFSRSLPKRRPLFNDFHAQIVVTAKNFCTARHPRCEACPLRVYL